jgi:hypothetical protein
VGSTVFTPLLHLVILEGPNSQWLVKVLFIMKCLNNIKHKQKQPLFSILVVNKIKQQRNKIKIPKQVIEKDHFMGNR